MTEEYSDDQTGVQEDGGEWVFTIYCEEIIYKGNDNVYVLEEIVKMVKKETDANIRVEQYKNGWMYKEYTSPIDYLLIYIMKQNKQYDGVALRCKEYYVGEKYPTEHIVILGDEMFSNDPNSHYDTHCIYFLNDAFGLNKSFTKSAAKN